MKRFFKIVGILLLLILVAIIGLKIAFNEDVPVGTKGEKAVALADKLLEALHAEQIKNADSITWTFRGVNEYNWQPQNNIVSVKWEDTRVVLDLNFPQESTVFYKGNIVDSGDKQEYLDYALSNFNNDSFWLIAPYKVKDAGTELEFISENELLVRYTTGGTTPGDVYVWKLDENYLPESFKMWVQIIPLDGVKANWKGWYETTAGFMLPEKREVYGLEIPLTDVRVYP
ncbi:hypothetical protein BST97_14295 [Nonlabens spongiae]|uniref:Uncharacterized protein n=1 Tax=Nonlabens spongiae TaxID=331648 RepID=A0A1W6MN77_9FLAO|nr:hypothetical protein [Nonlabens spongiae]ARN79064.1 hypothetical protein BST97_14295 [Nonlabens spongiae]